MRGLARQALVLAVAGFALASCSSTTHTSKDTTTSAATASTASTATTTTSLAAGSSGGSGEIQLDWLGVPRATGYRIYRATSSSGPFARVVDWNLATGRIVKATAVRNLWTPSSPSPPFTTVPGATPPTHYQYVEWGFPGDAAHGYRAYFRIAGYDTAGEAPLSRIECGAPLGYPQC